MLLLPRHAVRIFNFLFQRFNQVFAPNRKNKRNALKAFNKNCHFCLGRFTGLSHIRHTIHRNLITRPGQRRNNGRVAHAFKAPRAIYVVVVISAYDTHGPRRVRCVTGCTTLTPTLYTVVDVMTSTQSKTTIGSADMLHSSFRAIF